MFNAKATRAGLLAALEHAKKGAEFWNAQVTNLEAAIGSIDAMTNGVSRLAGVPKLEAPKQRAKPGPKPGKKKKAAVPMPQKDGLGPTEMKVEPYLSTASVRLAVVKEKKTASEIGDALIERLSPQMEAKERAVFKQRVGSILWDLARKFKISAEGEGRNRVYWKEANVDATATA